MTVIGLTGPSGSGKGKIAEILSEFGVRHIDADAVYHNILIPPSECLDELVEEFGYSILNAGGRLDRRALASVVFGESNRDKLERLNKITHKYVCARIRQIIRHYGHTGECACVIDAPLLFEAGLDGDCDVTLCVLADEWIRAQRIAARDGISCADAALRISSQKPDEFYTSRADFTVYNDGDEAQLREKLLPIISAKGIGGAK